MNPNDSGRQCRGSPALPGSGPLSRLAALLLVTAGLGSGWTSAGAETLRGLLVYGHEERSLQPCGPGTSFWVTADAPVREALQSAVDEVISEPIHKAVNEVGAKVIAGVVDQLLLLAVAKFKPCMLIKRFRELRH